VRDSANHIPDRQSTPPATNEYVPCLCGGKEFLSVYRSCPDRRHWTPGTFNIVRCENCRLVQTNPRPTQESIKYYYPSSYVSFVEDEHKDLGRLLSLLRSTIRIPYHFRYGIVPRVWSPTGAANRVLDIGCGAGILLTEMAQLEWEPWGIEPNEELAKAVTARLHIGEERIFVGTAEAASFADETFDLVTMSHVLEHLHDPRGVLSKVHGWLRSDGLLRIWVPNISSFESRIFRQLWHGLDMPRHLYHFDPSTLRQLIESCNFEIVRLVPQFQGGTFSASLVHVIDAMLSRRRDYRDPRVLYYSTLPIASILVALGNAAILDVIARKR
jgi:2-polyprenyl-3-methyl-5-hydroxy-6-metoxy-1,4-benzoquinol methylase